MIAECLGHGVPMRLDTDGPDAMLVCPECCDDLAAHAPRPEQKGPYLPSSEETR